MITKIFITACEPSGDLHGAHLAAELKKQNPNVQLRGLGGPQMEKAGVRLLTDMTKISALGLGDVIRQYFTYRKIFYDCLNDLRQYRPDALVLIDSPAFNLRLAKKIKKQFPVFYYISPQIWAWGGRRIHTIRKTISKMLVILPFEKALYEKAGVPVEFVGHPLLDSIPVPSPYPLPKNGERGNASKFPLAPAGGEGQGEGARKIALLPGSRESEVRRILPLMLESIRIFQMSSPGNSYFLGQTPNILGKVYETILKNYPDVPIRFQNQPAKEWISAMDFALITSGTATLEAALLGIPYFLFYKASWTTYFFGRLLIQVPYLGIVNILAGKKVVPEFIQNNIYPPEIAQEMKWLLENAERYQNMKKEFEGIRKQLGEKGGSRKAAEAILKFTSKNAAKETQVLK